MSKQRKSHSSHAEDPAKAAKPAAHDDEFVYVPRGKSKAFYILILALMVFTLIIFVVPSQFQALFRPSQKVAEEYLIWEHPTAGRQVVGAAEFQHETQQLYRFFELQRTPNARALYEPEAVAYFLVTDELAQAAGVEVTDEEIGKAILEGSMGVLGGMGSSDELTGLPNATLVQFQPFGNKEQYVATMRNYGISTAEYEETLRRVLRVMRYQNLMGTVLGQASPEEIEKAWTERHEQFSFDVASTAVADFEDEARAELAPDDELRAWYEALPPRSGTFADDWIPAGTAAEVVGWSVGGEEDAAGLLAAFPPPAEPDAETLAKEYYDSVYHVRFRRDEPLQEGEDPAALLYLSFDEVHDQALAEAPIRAAMSAWLEDVTARTNAGETVDLAAEAAQYGLHDEPAGEPLTPAEWRARAKWGGPYMANGLARPTPNDLLDSVDVEKSGIYFARVTARREAGPAPFEDVRDEVVDAWSAEHAGDLALAKAGELSEKLSGSDEVTLEGFAAGAVELGLTVEREDWFDPNAPQAPGSEPTPVEQQLRLACASDPAADSLLPATLDDDHERVWLLRCAGRRPPPELAIAPAEYQMLRRQASASPYETLFGKLLTLDAYRRRYALQTPGIDQRNASKSKEPEPQG